MNSNWFKLVMKMTKVNHILAMYENVAVHSVLSNPFTGE